MAQSVSASVSERDSGDAATVPSIDITQARKDAAGRPHPGDNFYEFANWEWLAEVEIAQDALANGAVREAAERTDRQVERLEQDILTTQWPKGSEEDKYTITYNAFLDEARVDQIGVRPLHRFFRSIRRARTYEDIARLLGSYQMDAGGLFRVRLRISQNDARSYSPHLGAASLLMGARGLYTQSDPVSVGLREDGKQIVRDLLRLSGRYNRRSPKLEERVDAIFELETALTMLMPGSVAERNPSRVRQSLSVEDLSRRAPGFPWVTYFEARGLPQDARIDLAPFENFDGFVAMFQNTPKTVWRDYLTARLMLRYGDYLTEEIAVAANRLGQLDSGVRLPMRARHQRAGEFARRIMPDIIARKYAEVHLAPQTVSAVEDMAENLRGVYADRIAKAEWLSDVTRAAALEKLEAMSFMIGVPPDWNTYADYEPDARNLFSNAYDYLQFRHLSTLYRLRERPVEPVRDIDDLRQHIFFSTLSVGAYYLPRLNAVIVPAAYLQPPFFDPQADMATNYGALGTTLGHEIGHAFDDQGAKFGATGKLENWWQPEDRAQFDALGASVSAQYVGYEVSSGIGLNTQLTLGENLSDLAGVQTALAAYQQVLAEEETGAQSRDHQKAALRRFFLGYANKRRKLRRPQTNRLRAPTDRHSPPHLRTNIILSNIDAWYDAFDIDASASLWRSPEDRIRVW